MLVVDNGGNPSHDLPIQAGKKILDIGVFVERVLFWREELFELKERRWDPHRVVSIQLPRQLGEMTQVPSVADRGYPYVSGHLWRGAAGAARYSLKHGPEAAPTPPPSLPGCGAEYGQRHPGQSQSVHRCGWPNHGNPNPTRILRDGRRNHRIGKDAGVKQFLPDHAHQPHIADNNGNHRRIARPDIIAQALEPGLHTVGIAPQGRPSFGFLFNNL